MPTTDSHGSVGDRPCSPNSLKNPEAPSDKGVFHGTSSMTQSSPPAKLTVLLLEDELIEAEIIEEMLHNLTSANLANHYRFQVVHFPTLGEGMAYLQSHHGEVDVILLDFMLPDSSGINSLRAIRRDFPQLPIIIETGNEDENLVVQAFQLGAQGYILKKNLDQNLLVYALQLAIEKHRSAQYMTAQGNTELEIESLEELAFSISGNTNITARLFGSSSLKNSVPDIFQEYVDIYDNLLDQLLEQHVYRQDNHFSQKLRITANKLGFLKASPRDVVDIHTQALKQKQQQEGVNPTKLQAYVKEGRIMLLELMGYLTAYYRRYYIGLSNIDLLSPKTQNRPD